MTNKMAYLGPSGTFCEEAAKRYINTTTWELVPYSSIAKVFAAIHLNEVDSGMVPIENSTEGSVNQTLDLLAYDYDLHISGEIILPVKQNLLTRPGVKPEEITRILSHPQALAQCRKYLSSNFDGLETIDISSTAEAARRVSQSSDPWAAIGNANAAEAYGLVILVPEIQERINNETRFITLSRHNLCTANNAKTSLLVYLDDKPGALCKTLEQFSLHNINLTKIESRPAQTRIGEYLFFIDIAGNQSEQHVKAALEGVKKTADNVRILGSYPSAVV